jgi:ABC-2 type transport system permease protein
MNQVKTLVRREFWEHRSLWMAPLIAAGVLVILSAVGAIVAGEHFRVDGVPAAAAMPGSARAIGGLLALSTQIFVVSTIAATAYLLDCLYAERKDRSILFWKSLPVSDAKTVLVKYGVAMVLVPLGVYVVAAVTFLVVHGIFSAAAPQVATLGAAGLTGILKALGGLLFAVLVTVLWYAPLGAWLLLASVLAKRSPWLIVMFVPIGLVLAERVGFQTSHVLAFLGDRVRPALDPLVTLQRPALWLGLVAAAGMLYIVVRLRRYRDDT